MKSDYTIAGMRLSLEMVKKLAGTAFELSFQVSVEEMENLLRDHDRLIAEAKKAGAASENPLASSGQT